MRSAASRGPLSNGFGKEPGTPNPCSPRPREGARTEPTARGAGPPSSADTHRPGPSLPRLGQKEGGFLQEKKKKTLEWFLKIAPYAVL